MPWKKLLALFNRRVERRYVFIITYGRSGSTLLMNILNSCDGCYIRGENNAALYGLYQSYNRIHEAKSGHGRNSTRETSPWWGIHGVDTERYAQRLRDVFVEEVIRPGPNDYVCGFKEIRFSQRDVPDLEGYIDFMSRFFPGAKFVVNHRKIADVASSKWWAKIPDAESLLTELDERLSDIKVSNRVFHFYYDDALQDRGHVQNLIRFLELPYDEAKIEEVFSVRHSY